MASREDPIQRAIFQFLCYQYPQAVVFSVPNELASKAGAVFNEKGVWEALGYVVGTRATSHKRPVMRYKLLGV